MTDSVPSLKVGPENGSENDALAELQDEVERLKNDQNEVRFLLIVIIVVLSNAVMFSKMENWAGALVIGIVEVFGLAVLARRMRIEEVPQMLSKFLDRAAERITPHAASNPPNAVTPPKPSPTEQPSPPDRR